MERFAKSFIKRKIRQKGNTVIQISFDTHAQKENVQICVSMQKNVHLNVCCCLSNNHLRKNLTFTRSLLLRNTTAVTLMSVITYNKSLCM